MPTVIPVKFKYVARDLWFDPGETGAQEGDHLICSTERGDEIGLATMDPLEMDEERLRATIGDATLKGVLRVATDEDLARAESLAQRGDDAFPVFRRLVDRSGLDMKPVGVEFIFGGGRAVCYFSAEERVDFRQLVRDLSHELHERVDMRQIGVREEAAIIGGFAHCGQELCCARLGRQFEPVSIRMAKEQDLPLNSTKISGACGRLMCCLRYEFEAYRDFKGRAPKRNAVIETPLGKGRIVEYDTPKEQICLRLENGKQVRVSLSDMEASEAAHKKSEELGCPCRPDTVTREALDKLESPEIKMALAELDRKMGVFPTESFDESDLFVDARPRRRRRKSSSSDQGRDQAQNGSGRSRRQAGKNASENGSGNGTGRSRRRRRKQQGGEAASAQGPDAAARGGASAQDQVAAGTPPRRRRRHHAADADGAQGSSRQPKGAQQERTGGMQPSRRKRRPGDKGGAAGAAAPQASPDGTAKHRVPAPGAQDGQRQQDAGQQEGPGKARRRRRRRGGRGREGGSGSAAE